MPNIEISTITVPIGGTPTTLILKGSGGSGGGGGGTSVTVENVVLLASGWTEGTGEYTQTVSLAASTAASSKVDIQVDNDAITQMVSDGTIGLYAENANGTIIVHAVGGAPSENLSVQCTVIDTISLVTPTLDVTNMPTRTEYDDSDVGTTNVYTGDGLVVTFTDAYGNAANVTQNCSYTITPDGGSSVPLSGNYTFPSNTTENDITYTIGVSYTTGGATYTDEFEVTLKPDIAHEDPAI